MLKKILIITPLRPVHLKLPQGAQFNWNMCYSFPL